MQSECCHERDKASNKTVRLSALGNTQPILRSKVIMKKETDVHQKDGDHLKYVVIGEDNGQVI